jgi:hypothetical protein
VLVGRKRGFASPSAWAIFFGKLCESDWFLWPKSGVSEVVARCFFDDFLTLQLADCATVGREVLIICRDFFLPCREKGVFLYPVVHLIITISLLACLGAASRVNICFL